MAIETPSGSIGEGLPELQVNYYPDTQTLTVYTDRDCHEGETLSSGFVVFYDADDNVAGFMVSYAAETLLKPFVDAILAKNGLNAAERDSASPEVLVAQD